MFGGLKELTGKKRMGKTLYLALAALLAGCASNSPYKHLENWLIREDPVRRFAVPADIFYVQGDLYTNVAKISPMNFYAQSEVGRGRFNGVARVFSPLITTEEDLECALDWYFSVHHEKKRPIIFIGEGEGGAFLKKYEEEHADDLKDLGLVASFYTDDARKGFVNQEMVKQIKDAIARARYTAIWGREMPAGMQN